MKKHLLVSALASVFMAAPAFAASALNCSGNVMLGATDSGVTDRSVGEQCINDLILDTPTPGAAMVSSSVTSPRSPWACKSSASSPPASASP